MSSRHVAQGFPLEDPEGAPKHEAKAAQCARANILCSKNFKILPAPPSHRYCSNLANGKTLI